MGKLDTNKKVKEDSLLNTAFSLFTTKGVSKTSISDIVNNAGVAKGTFYLYFKDKYDIRNKLVSHKSSQLFRNAIEALNASGKKLNFNERIIFIVDNIINQLNENKSLLTFIAKNLSWGVFKHALTSPIKDDDIDEQPCEMLRVLKAQFIGNLADGFFRIQDTFFGYIHHLGLYVFLG